MAKKQGSRSVIFYKRLIAAVLALVIVSLAAASAVLGVKLRGTRAELTEATDELMRRDMEEIERRAQEEAERRQNAIPPEQMKPAGEQNALEILADHPVVAHALGAVDGIDGLNCLEGFEASYAAGVRVFEADLRMTSDGRVVLRHDWIGGLQEGVDQTSIPTLEEFRSRPILEKYSPLSFRDLLVLMVKYPDVCIITDTKFTDAEAVTAQFNAMLEDAHALGLSYLFDRMVIQVYSPSHFIVVDALHHFPYYIYTLYQDSFDQTEDSFRRKTIFCEENGIMGLALWDEWWDNDYLPIADWRHIKVFIHTVNDARRARRLLRDGVNGIYTDTLTPADLEE